MNDLIVILILLVLGGIALCSCLRKKKRGCGGDCGGCGSCSDCGGSCCHRRAQQDEKAKD